MVIQKVQISMKRKLMAGLAVATLGLTVPVHSDTKPAVAATVSNPILADVQAGSAKRLVYELEAVAYFLFIPVTGKADFDVMLDGPTYSMDARVKTTGIADIFVDYDMRIASSGYVEDDGLQSYNFVSQNFDGKKNRRVEMTYGATDVEMVATPAFGNLGFPPATPEQKLAALDPITALIDVFFQPRSSENPCGDSIKIFDGRQLTHLNFTYIGQTDISTKAYNGKGIECHVKVDRVAGYKKGDKGSNLSGIDGPMKIYFAPVYEGMMAPVKIVVDTEDIGKITVSAKKLRLEDVASNGASTSSGQPG